MTNTVSCGILMLSLTTQFSAKHVRYIALLPHHSGTLGNVISLRSVNEIKLFPVSHILSYGYNTTAVDLDLQVKQKSMTKKKLIV